MSVAKRSTKVRKSGARPRKSGASPRRSGAKSLSVLFTCVGRRIELIDAFRRAANALRVSLTIHGADATRLSPAIHRVDKAHLLPPLTDPTYLDALAGVVRRCKIDLMVPLIDSELAMLAEAADRFRELGCTPLISTPGVIATCRDKAATFRALTDAGIDTPKTWRWSEVVKFNRHRFPYFLKPRRGSAARGNYVVRDADELRVFGRRVDDAIVQEFVDGIEHTLDVYTGFDGKPRCVVPRRRLEVRSGEVSKGLIVKDADIMSVGRRVAEMLGDCRGVITVQCIVTPKGRIRVIEINPRFGGGAPLAIHAGADFPKWILTELLGRTPQIRATGFRADVAMLRFDDSVFVPRASRFV